MKWKPYGETALISDCGGYTVAKYGTAQGLRYEAWRNGNPPIHMAACLDSADAARAVCESDLTRRRRDG